MAPLNPDSFARTLRHRGWSFGLLRFRKSLSMSLGVGHQPLWHQTCATLILPWREHCLAPTLTLSAPPDATTVDMALAQMPRIPSPADTSHPSWPPLPPLTTAYAGPSEAGTWMSELQEAYPGLNKPVTLQAEEIHTTWMTPRGMDISCQRTLRLWADTSREPGTLLWTGGPDELPSPETIRKMHLDWRVWRTHMSHTHPPQAARHVDHLLLSSRLAAGLLGLLYTAARQTLPPSLPPWILLEDQPPNTPGWARKDRDDLGWPIVHRLLAARGIPVCHQQAPPHVQTDPHGPWPRRPQAPCLQSIPPTARPTPPPNLWRVWGFKTKNHSPHHLLLSLRGQPPDGKGQTERLLLRLSLGDFLCSILPPVEPPVFHETSEFITACPPLVLPCHMTNSGCWKPGAASFPQAQSCS